MLIAFPLWIEATAALLVSGDGFQLVTSAYDEDEDLTWFFQLSIPEYLGAGEYEVGSP